MASRRHRSSSKKKKRQQQEEEGSTPSPGTTSGASRQRARELLQSSSRSGFRNPGGGSLWAGGLRGAPTTGGGKSPTSSSVASSSASTSAFPEAQTLQVDDGEVNAFFRQFSKRDPVTRVKALEQLTGLVDRRTGEELATVLHVWTVHFQKLAIDNDHRVRLHLIKCCEAIIKKTGKHILHYLPRIFPFWWLLTHDPHSGVAGAASQAFVSVFKTPSRQVKVLELCRDRFLRRFAPKLLTKATPASLCDLKVLTRQQAEECYDRVVLSCVHTVVDFLHLYIVEGEGKGEEEEEGGKDGSHSHSRSSSSNSSSSQQVSSESILAELRSSQRKSLQLPAEAYRKLFEPLLFSSESPDGGEFASWILKNVKSKSGQLRRSLYRCLRLIASRPFLFRTAASTGGGKSGTEGAPRTDRLAGFSRLLQGCFEREEPRQSAVLWKLLQEFQKNVLQDALVWCRERDPEQLSALEASCQFGVAASLFQAWWKLFPVDRAAAGNLRALIPGPLQEFAGTVLVEWFAALPLEKLEPSHELHECNIQDCAVIQEDGAEAGQEEAAEDVEEEQEEDGSGGGGGDGDEEKSSDDPQQNMKTTKKKMKKRETKTKQKKSDRKPSMDSVTGFLEMYFGILAAPDDQSVRAAVSRPGSPRGVGHRPTSSSSSSAAAVGYATALVPFFRSLLILFLRELKHSEDRRAISARWLLHHVCFRRLSSLVSQESIPGTVIQTMLRAVLDFLITYSGYLRRSTAPERSSVPRPFVEFAEFCVHLIRALEEKEKERKTKETSAALFAALGVVLTERVRIEQRLAGQELQTSAFKEQLVGPIVGALQDLVSATETVSSPEPFETLVELTHAWSMDTVDPEQERAEEEEEEEGREGSDGERDAASLLTLSVEQCQRLLQLSLDPELNPLGLGEQRRVAEAVARLLSGVLRASTEPTSLWKSLLEDLRDAGAAATAATAYAPRHSTVLRFFVQHCVIPCFDAEKFSDSVPILQELILSAAEAFVIGGDGGGDGGSAAEDEGLEVQLQSLTELFSLLLHTTVGGRDTKYTLSPSYRLGLSHAFLDVILAYSMQCSSMDLGTSPALLTESTGIQPLLRLDAGCPVQATEERRFSQQSGAESVLGLPFLVRTLAGSPPLCPEAVPGRAVTDGLEPLEVEPELLEALFLLRHTEWSSLRGEIRNLWRTRLVARGPDAAVSNHRGLEKIGKGLKTAFVSCLEDPSQTSEVWTAFTDAWTSQLIDLLRCVDPVSASVARRLFYLACPTAHDVLSSVSGTQLPPVHSYLRVVRRIAREFPQIILAAFSPGSSDRRSQQKQPKQQKQQSWRWWLECVQAEHWTTAWQAPMVSSRLYRYRALDAVRCLTPDTEGTGEEAERKEREEEEEEEVRTDVIVASHPWKLTETLATLLAATPASEEEKEQEQSDPSSQVQRTPVILERVRSLFPRGKEKKERGKGKDRRGGGDGHAAATTAAAPLFGVSAFLETFWKLASSGPGVGMGAQLGGDEKLKASSWIWTAGLVSQHTAALSSIAPLRDGDSTAAEIILEALRITASATRDPPTLLLGWLESCGRALRSPEDCLAALRSSTTQQHPAGSLLLPIVISLDGFLDSKLTEEGSDDDDDHLQETLEECGKELLSIFLRNRTVLETHARPGNTLLLHLTANFLERLEDHRRSKHRRPILLILLSSAEQEEERMAIAATANLYFSHPCAALARVFLKLGSEAFLGNALDSKDSMRLSRPEQVCTIRPYGGGGGGGGGRGGSRSGGRGQKSLQGHHLDPVITGIFPGTCLQSLHQAHLHWTLNRSRDPFSEQTQSIMDAQLPWYPRSWGLELGSRAGGMDDLHRRGYLLSCKLVLEVLRELSQASAEMHSSDPSSSSSSPSSITSGDEQQEMKQKSIQRRWENLDPDYCRVLRLDLIGYLRHYDLISPLLYQLVEEISGYLAERPTEAHEAFQTLCQTEIRTSVFEPSVGGTTEGFPLEWLEGWPGILPEDVETEDAEDDGEDDAEDDFTGPVPFTVVPPLERRTADTRFFQDVYHALQHHQNTCRRKWGDFLLRAEEEEEADDQGSKHGGESDDDGPDKGRRFIPPSFFMELGRRRKETVWMELAGSMYLETLMQLPALSRMWWSNSDRKLNPKVGRLTTKYFSGILIASELRELRELALEQGDSGGGGGEEEEEEEEDFDWRKWQRSLPTRDGDTPRQRLETTDSDSDDDDGDGIVGRGSDSDFEDDDDDDDEEEEVETEEKESSSSSAAPAAAPASGVSPRKPGIPKLRMDGEDFEFTVQSLKSKVLARFRKEDALMDLTITLPPDYPLHPPIVRLGDTVAFRNRHNVRWELIVASILAKDGSLLQALDTWRRHVARHFSDVDECPICYSLLHARTKEVPGLKCGTCSNTFHNVCLHTWFESSGTSNCPMCRSFI